MTGIATQIAGRLRSLREQAGVPSEYLDEKLILGTGWVQRFESGRLPPLDMLMLLVQELGFAPEELFRLLDAPDSPGEVTRVLRAVEEGPDLRLFFPYGPHHATYVLHGARLSEFEAVLKIFRDRISAEVTEVNPQSVKTDAVASSFLEAVRQWPHANPSDLWYFLVNRAYVDPYNHPARNADLDFAQSWKRTAGWALEVVLKRHYGPTLEEHGVVLHIGGQAKASLAVKISVVGRLELDKMDVLVAGRLNGEEIPFGVIHVKASFAERRTDDVPMSRALIEAGYLSPLWTMDAKASPSDAPVNRGELGEPKPRDGGPDRRSAKRRDIEDDGYFSACFSYNRATRPTPPRQRVRSRIITCDFRAANDAFAQYLISGWEEFSSRLER